MNFNLFTTLALFLSLFGLIAALPTVSITEREEEYPPVYWLVCTIGHSAQWCSINYDTMCLQTGHIINNAPISEQNGDCSSIWRHCYCESDFNDYECNILRYCGKEKREAHAAKLAELEASASPSN